MESLVKAIDNYLKKKRIYIRPGQQAPEGASVQRGKRGGQYYEHAQKVPRRTLLDTYGNLLNSLRVSRAAGLLKLSRTAPKKALRDARYRYDVYSERQMTAPDRDTRKNAIRVASEYKKVINYIEDTYGLGEEE
jgi:hypothetical protein